MSELLLLPRPKRLETLGADGAPAEAAPQLRHEPGLGSEAFRLDIGGGRTRLQHGDASGLRFGLQCLAQIRSQSGERLPALHIEDAPDFPVRGLMLDVSRDRVPTRATLERLVALLATLRLNHLELYTEHTFAYRAHEDVWREASPITPDDVAWLDALCAGYGIELCANQNTFGHMGRWLRHAAYRDRAEAPDGFTTKLGMKLPAGVLEPTPENADFALKLCRELQSGFTSRRINIGCDETFELGRGKSAALVAERGRERVYLEHLRRLLDGLHRDGREVLFWGDILRSHPELVAELPRKDTIALAWHYEAPTDPDTLPPALFEIAAEFGVTREAMRGFDGHVGAFADSGLPYWVCPGTSTWNTLLGRWRNARANLRDAAETGLARGASGYLITDWGDNGHMQPPSVSFLPLAYGAALSWGLAANRELAMAPLLDRFVFEDAASGLGALLEELGNVWEPTGKRALNGSPLFTDLVGSGLLGSMGEADEPGVARTVAQLEDAAQRLGRTSPGCVDGDLVVRELRQAVRLARHGACRIARAAGFPAPDDGSLRRDLSEAIEEQRACWLLRSRPGGLEDSVARLEATRDGYPG
jgi:hypothetical protein